MLRECFLGTNPPFELFHYFFRVRVQKNDDDICYYGGANLQLRPGSDYFKIALPKSIRNWHMGWFYVADLAEDLPAFVNEPPKRLKSWGPMKKPLNDTQELIDVVEKLKDRGLKGEQILKMWLE